MRVLNSKYFKIKFMLVSLAVIIFTLIIQIFAISYYQNNILRQKTIDLFSDNVYQTSQIVNNELIVIDSIVSYIMNNQRIKNYLADIYADGYYYPTSRYKIMREVFNTPNKNKIDNIYIFLDEFEPINCFFTKITEGLDAEFKNAFSTIDDRLYNKIYWSVTSTTPYTLQASTYIIDNDKILGILQITLDSEDLLNLFKKNDTTLYDNMFIVDNNNTIIFSVNHLNINKPISEFTDENDIKRIAALDRYNWTVIGLLDKDEIFLQSDFISILLFSLTIVIMLVICIFLLKTCLSILQTMKKVLGGMIRVQNGQLDFLENNSNDEFGMIVENFNFMIKKLRELLKTTVTQQKSYNELAIQSLLAKLNPHFLYNSLDMIYWKLILEDKDEIAKNVTMLANILRYSISTDKKIVTLKEDMEQQENYLVLQQTQLNNQLEYTITIQESLEYTKIPKLLIQPLIENSIKYAFKNTEPPYKIDITITSDTQFIYIVVKDNGSGLSEDAIKRISENKGLGVSIVKRLIASTYGDNSSLEISNNKGCECTLKLEINKTFLE